MFGQTTAIRSIIESSTRMEEDFFSVAITIPFDAGERDRDLVQSSSLRVERKLTGTYL